MSEEPKYYTCVIDRNAIAIKKTGQERQLEFHFTKSSLRELGWSLKELSAGLEGREEIETFLNIILNDAEYTCVRVKNKFLIYTKKEIPNMACNSDKKPDEETHDSIEDMLEKEEEDIPVLDSEEFIPPKASSTRKDTSTVLLRQSLFDGGYQE